MKKIYLAYSLYGVGGAQRRAANLANEFHKKGYDVTIIAVYGDNNTINTENYYTIHPDIKVVRIPDFYEANNDLMPVNKLVKKNKMLIDRLKKMQYVFHEVPIVNKVLTKEIRANRSCIKLKTFFEINEPGIVISFGFNIFELVYYALKNTKNKLIYAETNAIDKYKYDNNFFDTLKLINRADALVFQTAQQKIDLGVIHKKSFVIHNPIKADLPQNFNGERRKVIVNFCALKRQKNLLLLIKAFQKLVREDFKYADYELHLYCDSLSNQYDKAEFDYREELVKYINDNDLENSIRLLPMVNDVHAHIRDCSMFVSSSDYEGISNSMIEAMAIGLPCVCTDCAGGGAKEFIVNSENGILVERDNIDALYSAMKKMLDNPVLAEKCAQNAMKIREELSNEIIASQWINVILSV